MSKKITKLLSMFLSLMLILTLGVGCNKKDTSDENATGDNSEITTNETAANDTTANGDEQITLTFWHTYGDGEETQFKNVVLPMWEKEHPNIKIDAVRQDSSQYHQMIVTAFGTGQTPDIARIDIVNTASYANQGGLVALNNFDGFDANKANFLDGPLSTNLYNGSYYGLPLDTNCKAAVVNMNTLASIGLNQVPATFEEFLSAAEKSKTPLISVSGVGDWDFYPYFWLFGGTLTDPEFKKASGYLDSQASIDAINKLVELNKKKILTIKEVDGTADAWDGIKTGEYAMFFEGPWFFGSYEDNLAQGIQAALIPAYNGKSASVVGGENIVMFNSSKHQDAAYEFLKFMTSEEVQLAMLDVGQLPVLKSLVTNEKVTGNPVWSVYMKQVETAGARIPSPNHDEIGAVWSNAMTNIFVNKADVKSELESAAAQIDELLAQ
ncbi:extracellular solute-binding protein [Anaerocolumna xylanovorans]|uniref:Multiple sugar transport system substrate-binding protein n=1 Tax=Anaerocolumna xylanovorans DSM 12503 TaxID=1121345 RepID=A0A1M7XW80_9FIRM|nr:extracellular solute-binding protein [Anaerocolumna xylanovorans]SHO42859.1 multiple sugar transport system substrate-binding protein [Anaerocolumna xylanovorans DSM 12503]